MKVAFLLFCGMGLYACKSTLSKEFTNKECSTAKPDASPYSAKIFSAALEESVKIAAVNEENLDLLADFFPRAQIDSFLKGEVPHLLYSEIESCALNESIAQAAKGNIAELSLMRAPNSKAWGGSVLFHGDVFPQLTFEARTTSFGVPAEFQRKLWLSAKDAAQGTAWFEWREGTFKFHRNGSTRKVLEHLQAQSQSLELFRGAGADSSNGERIMSFRNESTMFGKDPNLVLQGVFFTTSESEARRWANPNLSSISTTPNRLLELASSDSPGVFLDFNRKNLDVAIMMNSKNPDTLDLLSTLTLKCSVSPTIEVPLANDSETEVSPEPRQGPSAPLCL